MTCRRFKKNMLMDIYGELRDSARRRLEAHLSRCASCREEFETTRKALTSLKSASTPPAPEVDWERSWTAVQAGLEPAGRRLWSRRGFPRWAAVPVTLAVLFAAGLIIGRYFWPSRPETPVLARRGALSPEAERMVLARFFDDVKPVLLDYAHDGTRPRNESLLLTDREVARSLLVQNLLLKRTLARRNPTLADLFDDLQMILTEIANLQSRDESTPASLKDVINGRQVLSRIRRLEKI